MDFGNLKETYYCAVLAKAFKLCESDSVQFSDIYELICSQTTKEEGQEIKQKAHDLSILPLHTLIHKVTWLEQLGVKSLHLSASKGDKVENIKADKEGNNSTVNLESTDSVKSLFETDSKDAAISGDKLAKQCQQNMAFELEQSIQFIDEDADSDEPVEPVLTSKNFNKKTEGQSPHMDENVNLVPEDGSSGSSVVNSAHSSIVDMLPIEELAVNKPVSFKYWERSPVLTPDDCRQERHAQHENAMIEISYEMTEMQRSDLYDKFKDNGEMKSLAGVDSTIVTKKKVKKKKKAKSKATDVGRKPDQTATAASDEYINNGNSCMESVEIKMEKMNNIGYIKNEASNLTDSLERQPLLGNNSFENSWSAGDTSNSSTKPKKRTIKKYQQEKEERKRQISYGNVDSNSKCLPFSNTKQSKTEKRKQDEMLKKEILSDEKVNSILQLCGDEATVSTESKKKFKENKQGVPKKDRKKTKKKKKGEKKKTSEQKKEDIESGLGVKK